MWVNSLTAIGPIYNGLEGIIEIPHKSGLPRKGKTLFEGRLGWEQETRPLEIGSSIPGMHDYYFL
jgi:hypothetical protein